MNNLNLIDASKYNVYVIDSHQYRLAGRRGERFWFPWIYRL